MRPKLLKWILLVISGILTTNSATILGTPANYQSGMNFSRDNVGVYFDLPTYAYAQHVNTYSEWEIMEMLDVVLARFSKLSVRYLPIRDSHDYDQYSVALIPIAAARINDHNNISSQWKKDKYISVRPSLELYMEYDIRRVADVPVPFLLTSFYSAKTIADKANRIFKNTVKYLFAFVGDLLNTNSIDGLVRHLTSVKLSINNTDSNNKYKLGVRVHMHFCGESSNHINKFLGIILPLVDFIKFSYLDKDGFSCGISPALRCTQMHMEKCSKKLSKLHPHLEVRFATSWSRQEAKSNEDDVFHMVHFWSKMNAWAVASNNTVFLYEAFHEDKVPNYNIMGWWKMEKNFSNGYTNTFLEQYTLISSSTPKNSTFSTISNDRCKDQIKVDIQNVSISSVVKKRNLEFSSAHFGVILHPLVKDTDNIDTYDEHDYVPFIEKISTRFANIHFSTPYLNPKSEISSFLLNAVAMCNKKNSGKPHHHTVQVFMSYMLESEDDFYLNRFEKKPLTFDLVKKAADSANLVHPGTVKYLLLNKIGKIDYVFLQLDYARRQSGNFTYDLGLTFNSEECDVHGIINTKRQQVAQLIKQVSLVVFEQSFVFDGVEATANFGKWTWYFSMCRDRLKKISSDVQVGFIMHWPDTNLLGNRNLTAFTWFWSEMNKWAIKTNSTVFMRHAFNTPFNEKNEPYSETTGWWKFVKDRPCYKNTSEYTFVEKLWEEEYQSTHLNTGNNNQYRALSPLKNYFPPETRNLYFTPPSQDKVHFSKEWFGVFFSPYLNSSTASLDFYSEEDVEVLLRIVQTRFSNVLMMPVEHNSRNLSHSHFHIPRVAAKLNKIREGNYSKDDKGHLQVNVAFSFEPYNISDRNADASTDLALQLADEANDIFVNTVPSIMMSHRYPIANLSHWKAAEVHIKYFQQRAHRKTNRTLSQTYQIGAILEPEYCQSEEFFAMAKQFLLPHLDVVVVRGFMTPQLVKLGVEESFTHIVRSFEDCKVKITTSFPNLKIGLLEMWPDTTNTWRNDPSNLVRFWMKMNEYAVTNGSFVFLEGAFDRLDGFLETGWWRLVLGSNFNGSEVQYMVQEKYQLLSQLQVFNDNEGPPPTMEDSGYSIVKVAVMTSSIGLGVVVIICVLGGLVIRKYRRDLLTAKQRLSEREVMEFFQGSPNDAGQDDIGEEGENNAFEQTSSLVKRFAYDTTLEVPQQAFVIDESLKLGSGAFGTVCMARVCKDGNEFSAAVKRVNPDASPEMSICSLRSLLSEVKVLSYLGQHEHIVRLLAVYTGDIRNGDICVFLEPCALGSLKKHLGTLCKALTGTGNDDYLDLQDEMPSKSSFDKDADITQRLFQWSLQIAQGMEFLACKQVVHADLATRNVLLDKNKVAKICDFGLSRKMYNNESYVKSKQEPLPWRWMPPESLRRWEFNEASDVWAYGITLWEIYTLGEIPYSGLEWDQAFFCRLEEGLCPRQPMHEPVGKYKETEMYQEIMLKCWEKEPNSRPMFSNIVALLKNLN